MDEVLTPRLLDDSMVERAYALVRNLAPGLSRARWRQFVTPLIRSGSSNRPRGLMSVQNHAEHILGLYRFEVRGSLHVPRVFSVDNIVVANLPGRDRIREAMIQTMEHLATLHGCPVVRVEVLNDLDIGGDECGLILTAFEGSGYAVGGAYATKQLTRAAPFAKLLRP